MKNVRFIFHIILLSIGLTVSGIFSYAQEGLKRDTVFERKSKQNFWQRLYEPSDIKPITRYSSTLFGIGGLLLKDTYLSPLKYGGVRFSLQNEIFIPMVRKGTETRWMRNYWSEIDLGITDNPARNASIYAFSGNFRGTYLYRWQFDRIQLFAGPGYRFGLGGLWSTRNGNNPGTIRIYGDIVAQGTIAYRLNSAHWPLLFRLTENLSLLGCGFSQDYGESYYEHFLLNPGINTSGLYFRHPGSGFSNRLLLTVDVPVFDWATLVAGYKWAYERSNVNHLKTFDSSHSFVIGFSVYLQTLKGRKNSFNRVIL